MRTPTSTNALCTLEEASATIATGAVAVVAGDESLLGRLPRGNWIGGTIPYFMAPTGGIQTTDRVFVTELPVAPHLFASRMYSADELPAIVPDAPHNGFSLIIIPSESPAHVEYAEHAPDYPGLFLKPIVGWIAGVALEDVGRVAPRVFDGRSGQSSNEKAIVLHGQLPPRKTARIDIINLFRGGGGDAITFERTGFTASECVVSGQSRNFARYLSEVGADTRLPLVADYHGAQINTSILSADPASGVVTFFAPVFTGIQYRLAEPVGDYAASFAAAVERAGVDAAFACNCILNYRYGALEGRTTGHVIGPITFGEVAYQLVNQTLVYLSIVDA
jgi:hypothetical protein